ncbi:nuclear pore complex protein NUP98B isoform X2 [Daucus carota subsp. sativus]|uniref:nuclear pore complex protein NUP98B isoform X2 n=1 Tax=Daucus carota subsp. sativus TaxID=79200 RepID=UPI0007F00547|nr:PREDICTED: nuclear pore complex protein NUP98B-like isoform X2 [Daucus carota subsp. sativus]
MFSSNPSSTSAFGSPLSFGQTTNSNVPSAIPFGSMQGTPSSPVIWGSSSASMGSSANGFGSPVGFGQSINPNVSSTGSSGSQYTFGRSSNIFGTAPSNGGILAGVSGGSSSGQSSNLFGSAPYNGGTSTGVFGGSVFDQSGNLFGSNNGGTSTGLFGQTASSSSSFGQSSKFFGSVPNNGGTSTAVFGLTASSSPFGQKNNIFGSAPNNGGSSTSVFGQTASSSSFGQRSNIFGSVPDNGGTSTGVLGQTAPSSSIGQRSNIFGSVINNGGTSTGLFATTPSSSPFGFHLTFGSIPASVSSASRATSSSPILWSSSTGSTTSSQVPASIASSSSRFGSGCMTSSGQTTVPWDTSLSSGTYTFSFGTQSSLSGEPLSNSSQSEDQVRAPIIGPLKTDNSSFWEKRGSRVTSYSKTTIKDDKGAQKLVSICAMPAYQNKSYDELRWEDHHLNAEGGGAFPAVIQSNDLRNPIARKDSTFLSPIPPAPFNPFSKTSNSFFNPPTPPVPFSPFDTRFKSPSIAHNSFLNPAPSSVPSNSFETTLKPPPIVQTSFLSPATPSVPSNPLDTAVKPPSTVLNSFLNPAPPSVPSSPFDSHTTLKPPPIIQNSFLNPAPPSVPSNPFDTPLNPPSIVPNSFLNPAPPSVSSSSFDTTLTPPTIGQYSFLNHVPPSVPSNPWFTTVTTTSYVAPFSPLISPNPSYNGSCSAPTISVTQPVSISEPNKSSFISSLPTPTSPQYPSASSSSAASMLTEGTRTAPPLRYGISCMPVCDKPAPARSPSLLSIRHLTYHRKRSLPIQKYKPRSDGPKVAFFDDAQETPTSARKEAPLLPRSNPKVFISGLYEDMKLRVNFNNTSFGNNSSSDTYKNGEVESSTPAPDQDGSVNQDKDGISSETDAAENIHNINSVHGNHPIRKKISSNLNGLMPKLKNSDYYFEPRVEELATKESYEPGFISHVKGFVVGRQGYGSIKFLEETDVRELDLESYIEFRNREVIVYMDEGKKPPVGQGLNKAAEITLCNIKVVDRKTGKQYVNGPNVDKFKEKLMQKTAQQGAEFVSYNPVQGEWKFRVPHF